MTNVCSVTRIWKARQISQQGKLKYFDI